MSEQTAPQTVDEIRRQLSTAMLDMAGILTPVYDAADGMRRELRRRGWSPMLAETAAGTWLCHTLASIGSGGRK